tara:strand:- start:281 stop:727 length:447 start_codon:yes stop_codon:yes gene_type:complete
MIIIKYYTALFLLIVMTIANGSELNIVSNELKIDRENEISIFKGNVYAISETFKIWSDELIVLSEGNKNKVKEIIAVDNVKIIKDNITAKGEKGLYNPNANVLTLLFNVEVYENGNLVKCDKLVLDLKNSTSIMTSEADNKVEALFIN